MFRNGLAEGSCRLLARERVGRQTRVFGLIGIPHTLWGEMPRLKEESSHRIGIGPVRQRQEGALRWPLRNKMRQAVTGSLSQGEPPPLPHPTPPPPPPPSPHSQWAPVSAGPGNDRPRQHHLAGPGYTRDDGREHCGHVIRTVQGNHLALGQDERHRFFPGPRKPISYFSRRTLLTLHPGKFPPRSKRPLVVRQAMSGPICLARSVDTVSRCSA